MFTVKNFRVVYVKYVYYLTKIRDRNFKVNLLKLYFKMLVSWKKQPNMKPKSTIKMHQKKQRICEDPTKSVTHDKNS